MRKSVFEYDPYYDPKAYRYEVFLDGQKIDYCHTADEELGVAYCYEPVLKDCLGREVSFKYLAGVPSVTKRGDVKLVDSI